MNTTNNSRPTTDELRVRAKQVETTANHNGYPSDLRVMYTADTMAELRELRKAAMDEGHEVNVYFLHRRDGWRHWHRFAGGTEQDLADNRWMGSQRGVLPVDVTCISDRHDVAFDHVFGERLHHLNCYKDLQEAVATLEALAKDLTDPDTLATGETVRHFVRDGRILYRVRTGDAGYCYGVHHFCAALEIIERNDNYEREDQPA